MLGFRVQGFGLRAWGCGVWICGLRFGVLGLGLKVQEGLEFGAQLDLGLGYR